ncbi:MAG: hypothetical protein M1838_001349 [Thelocarpon superellum]|nr:MAG: hypothetical protein M1838_001349 [Thelocarpon superellum]
MTSFFVPHSPDFTDTYILGDVVTLSWTFANTCNYDLRLYNPQSSNGNDVSLVENATASIQTYTWHLPTWIDCTQPHFKLKLGCSDDRADFTLSPAFNIFPASPTASAAATSAVSTAATAATNLPAVASAVSSTPSVRSSTTTNPLSSLGAKLGLGLGIPVVFVVAAVYTYILMRYWRRRKYPPPPPPIYTYHKRTMSGSVESDARSIRSRGPAIGIVLPQRSYSNQSGHSAQSMPPPAHLLDSATVGELEGARGHAEPEGPFAELEGDWSFDPEPLPPLPLQWERKTSSASAKARGEPASPVSSISSNSRNASVDSKMGSRGLRKGSISGPSPITMPSPIKTMGTRTVPARKPTAESKPKDIPPPGTKAETVPKEEWRDEKRPQGEPPDW